VRNLWSFRRVLWLSTGFVVCLLAVGCYAFVHAGVWLIREDPLARSEAAVVLSGGLPERALAAADIYRAGYVHEIWLTQPLQPSAAMEQLKLPYAGEEEYSRMVLIGKGVPPTAIRILQPKITNTEEELRAIEDQLQSAPVNGLIVVTSKAHTRRVHALWKKIGRGDHQILVRAAAEDYFDQEHWWRSSNDALTVVREYLGILNAWAGLPLRHTR
jgi:uncharacterized SAM-binding protein YcdF (DUF218 family)